MKPLVQLKLLLEGTRMSWGNRTGMPMYDAVLDKPNYSVKADDSNYWRTSKGYDWEVVDITPQAYLEACARGFKLSLAQTASGREDLSHTEALVAKGVELDIPVLEYGKDEWFAQEGLHRVLYAKQIGEDVIPVLIFTTNSTPIEPIVRELTLPPLRKS